MSDILRQMMTGCDADSISGMKNSLREAMQEVTLYCLSTKGFFDKAAFYGGTALRLFYGLDRSSEDLDFTLISKDEGFDIYESMKDLDDAFKELSLEANVTVKGNTFK